MDRSKLPWARMAAEGVLIVVSVLLAFGIDAWWAGRKEGQARLALLEELETEFHANVAELEAGEADHLMFRRSADRLLGIRRGDEPFPGSVSFDSLLHHVFLTVRTFNPSTSTLQVLQSSHGATASFSLGLRIAVGRWSGLLEDNAEDELRAVEYLDGQLAPFLSGFVPFANAFRAAGPGMVPAYGQFSESPDSSDHRALLRSREFENHVVMRAALERLIIREHGKLREAAASVLELIDRERER